MSARLLPLIHALTIPQETNELVNEWTLQTLDAHLASEEQSDLAFIPVISGANRPRFNLSNTVLNLASYNLNFMGLAGNETIKVRAISSSGNMVSAAVEPLNSMALLMRFCSSNGPFD